VAAHCTGPAAERAREVQDRRALVFIADRGKQEAALAAEQARSAQGVEQVVVNLAVDVETGALRTDEGTVGPGMVES
jgi:hypothetical protein